MTGRPVVPSSWRNTPPSGPFTVANDIDHVRKVAPETEEGRSYGVPAFRYHGKPLLGLAATKQHLTLYPFSPAVVDSVKDRLADFKLSKGAVRSPSTARCRRTS